MLTIRDGVLYAQTKTLSAVIRDGAILSLKSVRSGTEFIRNTDTSAMELVYAFDRSWHGAAESTWAVSFGGTAAGWWAIPGWRRTMIGRFSV